MVKEKDYYSTLAQRESSNNPRAKSREGSKYYAWLYQLGEAALIDAKFYNPKPLKPGQKQGQQYNNDWSGTWTKKAEDYEVNNIDDFLNNPDVQDIAIRDFHKIIWDGYLKDYQQYEGQEVVGIKLDKSAMISCAHLVGHTAMKKFINSQGQEDEKDGNEVRCSQYLKEFMGYDIDFSVSTQPSSNNQPEETKQQEPNLTKEQKKQEAPAKQEQDRKTTEEAQNQQVETENVRLEQELAKAELECKAATEIWNEWSAGIGRNAPYNDPNNPERIKRDKECQDTWKKVSELKEEIKTQKAKTEKKSAEDTAKQQQEQEETEKTKQEQEAKKKEETEAQQAKTNEEAKKAAEEAEKLKQEQEATAKQKAQAEQQQKAEADKKAQEETAAKQAEDAAKQQQEQAAAAEAQKQQAEADKAKQEQEARAQGETASKQAEETQKAESDKKAAEDTAKQQEQNKQDSEPQILLTQEALDRITPEEQEAADKEFAEVTARYEKAEADKKAQEEQATEEAQKLQVSLAETGKKQIQEMENFSKRDELSRKGVKVDPTMDNDQLDRAEQSHKISQALEENQKRLQHTDDFIHEHANISGSTSANTNTTSVLDLGHYAIGTGSRPNNQGHLEFTPCSTNPDALGNEPNSGVNLIGTDQSHPE